MLPREELYIPFQSPVQPGCWGNLYGEHKARDIKMKVGKKSSLLYLKNKQTPNGILLLKQKYVFRPAWRHLNKKKGLGIVGSSSSV